MAPRRHSLPPEQPPRVIVDRVLPEVDAGRYRASRTEGDRVPVRAHVFADGHELLQVVLMHRRKGARTWTEVPMRDLGNDEWEAEFVAGPPGVYEYTVEGWVDRFGSWKTDLRKRIAAGWDVSSELLEGAHVVEDGASRAPRKLAIELRLSATWLGDATISQDDRVQVAMDPLLDERMRQLPDRSSAGRYPRVLELWVDRERARFGAWYEMFPRSAGSDPDRGATFREAAERFPDIAGMGFDVLYLPPIHPIGHTARKGPNNTLLAGPHDPGSPWAIGSEEGGHKSVHPDLGTIEDFDWFVQEAAGHGLEVALDLAYQCSPDHPWVREHPEWFRHRPDGTIKYAENPPKQYQDIYPINFETSDWRALWLEMKSVVDFWVDHGVKIFRVDNPHTKPFAFWEWMIGEVQRDHPDVIFLAEAFTRPKRLYGLAKLGFAQSYSYFTWRNTRAEITEFVTEITRPPVSDFLRANLFANTPDILHEYLQIGGRPAFLVRLVLAATLGPSYGIYSGFELCENQPAAPGSEEYLDSEKFQVKPRDWDAPGNIKDTIRRLNELRRTYPALQHNHDVWFLPIDNDQVLAYSKAAPDGAGHLIVLVNLDFRSVQEGWVGLPIAALGIEPDEPFIVRDLLTGERFMWRGEWNFVSLDPGQIPAHVLVVESRVGTEQERVEIY